MADQPVTKEKLINADKDVDSLGEAANEVKVVNPRYGNPYYSGPMAVQHIMDMGGWDSFPTQVELQESTPVTPTKVAIALDTGFLWRFSGGVWANTNKKPFQKIYDYVDSNALFKPFQFNSTNWVAIDNLKQPGWYIVPNTTVATNMGLPVAASSLILVASNPSNTLITQTIYTFNSSREFTRTSNVSGVFPLFEELATLSAVTSAIAATLVGYVSKNELPEMSLKPYDIVEPSKNLYDANKKQLGVIVGNNGAIQAAAGWSCTDFIPVNAGEYYTISFTAKRQNLAFYSDRGGVGTLALEYNASASNPLTVQAPVGANYLVVNLDSTTITATNVQVEVGQTATSYEKGGKKYSIDANFLSTNIATQRNLKIDGDSAIVTGAIDNTPISLNLSLTKANTHDQSTVFNFTGDYVNDVLQRNLNDDVAPMRLDNATIGANHGYRKTNLTASGHSKTESDIGSVWTNGAKEFVIVEIVSSSVLAVTSRTDNTDATATTFTHVSGAANTASFTPTATVSAQWYPAIRDRKLTCFVDDLNIDLSKSGTYNFKNTVKFLESYSIMKKSDIVEWLILNKGVNHVNYDAVPAYTVNFGYTLDHECGCTIYFGGVGRKTVDLVDQMITQSIQLSQGNGTVYNYIPKAVEFTAGGYTYNFSQLENLYAKNPSTALYLTAARQEAGTNPIDRIVMLNDQVGYATGYLPVLDAAPSVRPTNASNKYLEIRNGSLKLYPRLIDSASITQINEGDAFAAIAYRKYFKRSTDRTCKYVVRSEMGDYLYLDWHSAKTDDIELPADLVGREFEIVEKSSNVTLLSKFASNSILVKIDATKNYGYLVIKFK